MARQKAFKEGTGTSPVPSKDTSTSSEARATSRRKPIASSPDTQRTSTTTLSEEGDAMIKLVHPRLLAKNVENQEALVRQRRTYGPDLIRRTFDLGDRVESALGPADQETGKYGKFEGRPLAEDLIRDINALIEFAIAHGQVPTRIQMLNERLAALEDIRSLLRVEIQSILQPLLQTELRATLREELLPLLQSVPLQPHIVPATPKVEQGLLTEVASGAENMLNALFPEE